MRKESLVIIIFIGSFFFGSGALMVLIAASIGSYHAIWIIFFDAMAAIWPALCGGCDFRENNSDLIDYDRTRVFIVFKDLGFFLMATFLITGTTLPVILHHNYALSYAATQLSLVGGTFILISVLIFIRFFVYKP